jgi:hypothetical protein
LEDVLGEITAILTNKRMYSRITHKEGWLSGICRAITFHQSLGCPIVVQSYSPPFTWTPFLEIATEDGKLHLRSIQTTSR